MIVEIKKLHEEAIVPTRGSAQAAGYDLYAVGEGISTTIASKATTKISTGIAMAIPNGYVGLIYVRSGIAVNRGLRPANCVGVIDSDYRGEIIVALHNDSEEAQTIHRGDRIAQIVITPYLEAEFKETEDLSDTERGDGGFGSTGTK